MVKLKYIFMALSLVFAVQSFAQKSNIPKNILKTLQSSNDGGWNKINDSTLLWTYFDTFQIVNRTSSVATNPILDSLVIRLTFSGSWTDEKITDTRKNNAMIISPLSKKFISAMDSINWKDVNINKLMFLENELLYLYYAREITKITDQEIVTLKELVSVPSYIYKGNGVYLNTRPNYNYQYVNEIEVDVIMFEQLKFIAKTLESEKIKIGINPY